MNPDEYDALGVGHRTQAIRNLGDDLRRLGVERYGVHYRVAPEVRVYPFHQLETAQIGDCGPQGCEPMGWNKKRAATPGRFER